MDGWLKIRDRTPFEHQNLASSDFKMNEYPYDDIALSGSFKNKAFIGKLQLTDKAIELDFNGNIDFNVQLNILPHR